MTPVELLKRDADYGWKELSVALEGVSEGQAWAILPNGGSEYLHTDSSIFGITLHVACSKYMNGSVSFRNCEHRWRQLAERIAGFEPNWDQAVDFLRQGQKYWMDTWAVLKDIEEILPTATHGKQPAWRIIQMMNQHDAYHAGQIAILRYAIGETHDKPTSVVADIHQHCRELIAW